MSIIALIPARSGSKGLKNKNIKMFNGKPLICWTIESALACDLIDEVYVSTDSQEIANISLDSGAAVPFLRPKHLSKDEVLDFPVYEHFMKKFFTKNTLPDNVVWLRPTSPIREVNSIHNAISIFLDSSFKNLRSVCSNKNHPYWTFTIKDNSLQPFLKDIDLAQYGRRQKLPPAYCINGSIDINTTTNSLDEEQMFPGPILPFLMDKKYSIDIDDKLDFIYAERVQEILDRNA